MYKFFIFIAIVLSLQAEAKQFKTQFFSLKLPPNWDCAKEELDYVCQPDNLHERSEVIMVIVTKAVDPVDDTVEKYLETLKKPQTMRDLLGKSYKSEVKYARINSIRDREWVDSLQFGSEIPGFFTRYLASIEEKVAGLVTYAIAESAYAKWAPVMEDMIKTIELKFDAQAFDQLTKTSGSLISSRGNSRFSGRSAPPATEAPQKQDKEDDTSTMILVALMLAAVVGYIIYKRKNKA